MRSVSVSNLPYEENFGFENDEELPNSPLVELPNSPLVNNKLMKILCVSYFNIHYSKYSRMIRNLSNLMMMWFKFEEIQFQKSQKSVLIQCT